MTFTYEYPRPAVSVDAILVDKSGDPEVLLIKRNNYPFEGMWALPGGFVDMEETLEEAVERELKEETSIEGVDLIQFHAFSKVDRDPRHRTISVIFFGFVNKSNLLVKAGDDAGEARWFKINELGDLAFDHNYAISLAKKTYDL